MIVVGSATDLRKKQRKEPYKCPRMDLCTVSKAYLDCENIYSFPTSVFNTWWRVNSANEADISKWTRECTKFKQIYYLTFKGKNWAKTRVRDKCDKKDDENDKIEWQKEKRPSIHTNTCIQFYGWLRLDHCHCHERKTALENFQNETEANAE